MHVKHNKTKFLLSKLTKPLDQGPNMAQGGRFYSKKAFAGIFKNFHDIAFNDDVLPTMG